MSEDEANGDGGAVEDEPGDDEQPADLEEIRGRLEALAADLEGLDSTLEAAETEDDLDVVEADLESFRPNSRASRCRSRREIDEDEADEDEEPAPEEELQRGVRRDRDRSLGPRVRPRRTSGAYGDDVVSEINDASGTITGTRWTEEGKAELIEAVDGFLDELNGLLESSVTLVNRGETVPEQLDATLDDASEAVEDAALDADDDAETIAGLLEATDDLQSDIDDATECGPIRDPRAAPPGGYYDVLDHVRTSAGWHALKVHEKQGKRRADPARPRVVRLRLHGRTLHGGPRADGAEEAIDPMLQKANRRDQAAMAVLGRSASTTRRSSRRWSITSTPTRTSSSLRSAPSAKSVPRTRSNRSLNSSSPTRRTSGAGPPARWD